uniref:Uncharacterized protein n=1 Tax=Pyricularia oryzae (strain P131) TaxID=1143193 RepID=L7JLI3_PYRO1
METAARVSDGEAKCVAVLRFEIGGSSARNTPPPTALSYVITGPYLWRRPSIENNMDVCEDGKDAEGFIAAKLRKGNGLFKGAEDIRAVWSID